MRRDIARLPTHIADLIAAGEVVERPASVVKELVENAVDAGAQSIVVEIQRGGAALIRVTDDGSGIAAKQAETAFLRHATSKIRTQDDLYSVRTLGFRGEALAAIAAVSRISLLTREKNAEAGVSLLLEAGRVLEKTESGCPEGTTIIVRDLFFNTPARAKFMRKDATEASHAQEVVYRAALSHPEISVRLIKDGTEILHTPGNGDLKSCIYSLYGSAFALSMVKVDSVRGDIAVTGFAGSEEAARSSRGMQIFMVDGRPVRSRTLTAALEEAYKNEIPSGRYPVCIIHLHLPPGFADVNVHPAKSEIKFSSDRPVFDALYFAVMSALQTERKAPELKISRTQSSGLAFRQMDAAEFRGQDSEQTVLSVRQPSVPFDTGISTPKHSPETARGDVREYPVLTRKRPAEPVNTPPLPWKPPPADQPAAPPAPPAPAESVRDWRYIGQALGGYLLVETQDSLFLIDRHAAHERILYDRLRAGEYSGMSQQLIEPLTVTMPPAECDALAENSVMLSNLGFELESFGGSVVLVRGAPSGIETDDIPATLSEIAAKLLSGAKSVTVNDDVMHIVACKAAVKLNKRSGPEDMRGLAEMVMETPELRHCPHGRPVAIRLTRSQLDRQFGR